MAWAAKQNGKIVSVAYDKAQLSTDEHTTIVELSEDVCHKVMTGHMTIHEINNGKPIAEKPVRLNGHISVSGQYAHLHHWEFNLFGKLQDTSLINNRYFFIWDWRHRNGDEIAGAFPWDEFNYVRHTHSTYRMSVIIDNSVEAPNYHNHLRVLCDKLVESGIQPKDILLWSTIDEPMDIPVYSIDTKCGYTVGLGASHIEHTSVTNYHFIMLARTPRVLRVIMADQILSRQLDQYGNMSCGSWGSNEWYNYNTSPYIKDTNKDKFPILLDGEVKNMTVQQFDVSDTRINQAAINVICETSQDAGLDIINWWTVPFITEKTSKAMLLCQLPLFISVPGVVDKVRRDGFDVFDDLIDHSYDNEINPIARVNLVADQLEKLCNIQNIAELRSRYWDRLLDNRSKILKLFKNINNVNATKLEQWLKDTQ